MSDRIDQRESIVAELKAFDSRPIAEAARRLFSILGYKSDRTLPITTAQQFRERLDPNGKLTDRESEALDQLQSLHLLFQLSDVEFVAQDDMFDDRKALQATQIESYLFFAAELPAGQYTRTALSTLVRAVNKPLPMPALVLFRYGDYVSLGIIHRRLHKRDQAKDVLEKVTLIKDIACPDPIRAHIEILNDFVLANLDADFSVSNFVRLHEAWQKRLGSYALSKDFYHEIADWYFWAHHQVDNGSIRLPLHCDTEQEKSLFLIRLLTRIVFCWFLIEKRLIPTDLFREHRLKALLKDFQPSREAMKSDTAPVYYRAILQNLFFGTLNMPPDQRAFRQRKQSGQRYDQNYGVTNLWRYETAFRSTSDWLELAKHIPFLNGGLFDCLDDKSGKKKDNFILDGFSDREDFGCHLPNDLFFGAERIVDLSHDYGEDDKRTARSKKAKVRGLIEILSRYKFTIEENTPLEEEIALDPELLGKVFENLLASYNEDTRTTARKALGAFYTPREIVTYMVDEALKSYLGSQVPRCKSALEDLFSNKATLKEIKPDTCDALIAAIGRVKILDPACGSGAFLMGALHRLVDLLQKLDPNNVSWKHDRLTEARCYRQILEQAGASNEEIAACEARIADIEKSFDSRFHALDFARKLYLIENCIYGVDIQPIATQIAKLRFFISLVVDQKVDAKADNLGVRPLPNLETRLVAADTLMPIEKEDESELFVETTNLSKLRAELTAIRHEHFNARSPAAKRKWREADDAKRKEIATLLEKEHFVPHDSARKLAAWDPYDQNTFAPFFDSEWMFGLPVGKVRLQEKAPAALLGNLTLLINEAGDQTRLASAAPCELDSGFDIVIGNPPYSAKQSKSTKSLRTVYDWVEYKCDPYAFFIEAAHRLINPRGSVALIVPLTWLTNVYYEKLRKQLIDGGLLRKVVVIEGLAFKSANVDTCLLFTSGAGKESATKFDWASSLPNLADLQIKSRAYRSIQNEVRYDIVPKFDTRWEQLKSQIERDTEKLGSFSKISLGMKLAGNDRFVVREKDRKHPDIIVFGDDISLNAPVRPSRFFCFRDAEIVGGTKNPAVHHANPKILVQAIRNLSLERRIVATIDTAGFCFVGTVNAIIPSAQGWDAFLLLGLINSQLLNTYFRNRFTTISLTSAFLGELPIKRPKRKSEEASLSSIANLLFHLNGHFAAHADKQTARDPLMLAYWEQVLNGLVYELYFPEEVQGAGLRLFDLVEQAQLPDIHTIPESDRLPRLRNIFETLYNGAHPLRIALAKLQTLDIVRIIEGKA